MFSCHSFNVFLFAAFVLVLSPLIATAQDNTYKPAGVTYSTETDLARKTQIARDDEQANERAYYEWAVGKRFWVLPGDGAPGFYTTVSTEEHPDHFLQGRFIPNTAVSFEVTELVKAREGHYSSRYIYVVRIEDGTLGLMHTYDFGEYRKGMTLDSPRRGVSSSPLAAAQDAKWFLYTEPPQILSAKYHEEQRAAKLAEAKQLAEESLLAQAAKQKAAATAKARQAAAKRKGGVWIGMTAQQARASNWGKPTSVNRSTGSWGTDEQWVYDGGNYLYFRNGVLNAVQN